MIGLLGVLLATAAMAEDSGMEPGNGMGMGNGMGPGMHQHMMMHGSGMMGSTDKRTSLGIGEPMKSNQLAMMRDHLAAVNEIVALIAAGSFDKASNIAHQRLGLTPEMQKMCRMFGNADFQNMGIAFHKSADHLGDVLKSRDTKASLNALHDTMNYCIACHQAFRQ